jgi:acetyltransferase-like isoleucine patch superfamily enzyme
VFKEIIRRLTTKKEKSLPAQYPQYRIGKGSYGTPRIYNSGEGADLQIGAFCSIAEGVKIMLGGEHRTDWVTTFPFNVLWETGKGIHGHPATKGNVKIGNDVWIGTEAIILSGVIIGDGAVIGARAVVTRNVPPYAVAAGVPARIVKKRFDEKTIERLIQIKWWEWDDNRIERAIPLLLSEDIESFLKAAELNDI